MADQRDEGGAFDPYAGLIWVEDAARPRAEGGYGRSRTWFWEQISAGRLDKKEVPGDRKTFLWRNQVEALLMDEPKPQPSRGTGTHPLQSAG